MTLQASSTYTILSETHHWHNCKAKADLTVQGNKYCTTPLAHNLNIAQLAEEKRTKPKYLLDNKDSVFICYF